MGGSTRSDYPSRKKFVSSLILSLILIGSTLSSIGFMGLIISPQYALAAVPSQPVLSNPADGVTTATTPTLQWNRITGMNAPTSYNVQIDNDGTGFPSPTTSSVAQPGSGGTVSFTPSTLALGSYAWRVQGVNADGSGAFSATRTFTVALAAPTLTSPADAASSTDQTPTFTWNRITGASSYRIQVDTSSAGTTNCSPSVGAAGLGYSAPVAIDQTVSDPGSGTTVSFTPITDLADGNYVWHVRSITGTILGCYSNENDLTIDDTVAPVAPTLSSPADGIFTNDQTPFFDWSDVTDSSGINRYNIQISTAPTLAGSGAFTTTVVDTNVQSPAVSEFQQATNLLEGTYYWHVRARDNGNNFSPFSSIFSFTIDVTDPAAPVITSPTAGTQNTDVTVISGTSGEEGLTIEVFDGTTSLGTTTTAADGSWTVDITDLGEGIYSFTAVATDAATNDSPPSDAVAVTVDQSGPTVTASPIGGTYSGTQSVTLSSESGATIYFTTNGNTPTGSSSVFTTAISISATTTLKAIAKDSLGNFGAVMTEIYTINTGPATIDTSLSLQLSGNNKVKAGDTFTATGKLINAVADSPIAGKTLTFKIDTSTVTTSPATVTTDSKGKFTATLTAPLSLTVGNHQVQVLFAGDSQYNPSSMTRQLKVLISSSSALTFTGTDIDTSLSLKLSKDKVNANSAYIATGTLTDVSTGKPIMGKMISVTTDDSSAKIGITDAKGKYQITLIAPGTNGDHNIQAHFAATAQYKSSDSPVSKLTVQRGTSALTITANTGIDTSLSLKIDGKDKLNAGESFTASGKLIDATSKKPLSGKTILVDTDGGSPKESDTSNSKGEFKVSLKAPDNSGKHDIQAHFNGDSQYKSSDSSKSSITVEAATVNTQQSVTAQQEQTDEETDDQTNDDTDDQTNDDTDKPEEEQTDNEPE